ncbi:ABC-type transport auxiliary lipoprotein family protein [Pararhodospirillum oryzae]|uniref:ABC-type transport auxiliary lipoprotein component domain-containing protein n=1 Tax=Pararhodospirillum oryzae TaxID=478448 RepID=A0A512H906_9PROT|nr:ABC-type transport auxiliary lipoprotein family protein [Pararhodospirillum oryzae]GEO81912.1 hypothetical protein ROR02_20430 [Pararhodospirillum oryzae]
MPLIRLALVAAVCLGLAACATTTPQGSTEPRLTLHHLDVRPLMPPPLSGDRAVGSDPRAVIVTPVAAEGALQGRAILYSGDRITTLAHPLDQWDEALPRRLQRDLVAFLLTEGPFSNVVGGSADAAAGGALVLNTHLLRFEHYVAPSAPGITVSLELSLFDPATDTVRLVGTYTETQPLDDPSVEAAVRAMGQAVRRVFGRFVADLSRVG